MSCQQTGTRWFVALVQCTRYSSSMPLGNGLFCTLQFRWPASPAAHLARLIKMRKPKLYMLPKSLRDNQSYDDLRALLNSRYLRGARAIMSKGGKNPREARVIEMAALLLARPLSKYVPLGLSTTRARAVSNSTDSAMLDN